MIGALLASLASGALFCLSLPPADVWWLGWFAFVPMFVACRGKGFLYGFGSGLMALLTCALLAESGIFYAAKSFEGTEYWIYTGCGLYGFVVSILAGVWADAGSAKRPLWWFAALAIVLEACLLIQLPAHLGLTQHRQPALLFLASLGGIWLVSFLVWLGNFAVSQALLHRNYLAAGALPVLLTIVPVMQRTIGQESARQWSLNVGIVQTEKTDEQALARLHQEASQRGMRNLVVWPEFAGLILAPSGNTAKLEEIASRAGNVPLVTSYNDAFQPKPHNVATLVTATGTSEPYYKRRLFGGEKQMHTAGEKAVAAGPIGLNICFDSCYPSIVRATAQRGNVQMIALPTIDPPSPHTFIAALHAAFTPFRAAENGIPIARADGYARSMIVDGDGTILVEAGKGEVVDGAKVSPPFRTVYRQFGDWFLYLAIAVVVLGPWLGRGRKKASENLFAEDGSVGS